jgi:hypothetical protein
VARPSTEQEQIAALVASGKITTSTLWRTCGATPYNSQVVLKAQNELFDAQEAATAAKEEASAREKAEAEAVAIAAKTKHGAAGDDKLELKDLKAVVKFTHIKLGKTCFSNYNTKVLCPAVPRGCVTCMLPAVSEPGAPAPAPPRGAHRWPAAYTSSTASTGLVLDTATSRGTGRWQRLAAACAPRGCDLGLLPTPLGSGVGCASRRA